MRADLHVHSARSHDGVLDRAAIAAAAKAKGIAVVAVCDHDKSPQAGDFPAKVEYGVLFIPAIEYSTERGHLLGLFLTRPVAEPPTGKRMAFADAAAEIRAAGGLAVLAHPFEQADDFAARAREIEPLLPHLDGIEVFNSRADYKHGGANAAAAQFAAAHGITCVTAGSDAHRGGEVGNAYIEADCPCTSDALRAALTAGAKPAGVRSPRRHIALSQLTKAKKQKLGARRTLKSAALLCYLTIKDIFQK